MIKSSYLPLWNKLTQQVSGKSHLDRRDAYIFQVISSTLYKSVALAVTLNIPDLKLISVYELQALPYTEIFSLSQSPYTILRSSAAKRRFAEVEWVFD